MAEGPGPGSCGGHCLLRHCGALRWRGQRALPEAGPCPLPGSSLSGAVLVWTSVSLPWAL